MVVEMIETDPIVVVMIQVEVDVGMIQAEIDEVLTHASIVVGIKAENCLSLDCRSNWLYQTLMFDHDCRTNCLYQNWMLGLECHRSYGCQRHTASVYLLDYYL